MKRTLQRTAPALLLALACAATAPAWAQKVKLSTTMGDVTLELDREKAPKTVDNFLQYVRAGHYSGTIFHRVIDGFMIQGGGYKADLSEKPTRAPIALESRNGLSNVRGTVAMARTGIPDSATAQFFINVNDNTMLDQSQSRDGHGYAVFGKVVEGMDVVDKIRTTVVKPQGMHQHMPATPITVIKATVEK